MECCNKKMKPSGYSYNPAERIKRFFFFCYVCGKKISLDEHEEEEFELETVYYKQY